MISWKEAHAQAMARMTDSEREEYEAETARSDADIVEEEHLYAAKERVR